MRPALLLAVIVASFSFAAWASGEPPTRATYVIKAEAICRTTTARHRASLQGVASMVRRHELKSAGVRLQVASRALGNALGRLAAVPRPPADRRRLAQWFTYGRIGKELLERMSDELMAGNGTGISAMADRLLRDVRRANAVVAGFEFDYCRIDPSGLT